jgi:murein L,D-transpeptidase YafK
MYDIRKEHINFSILQATFFRTVIISLFFSGCLFIPFFSIPDHSSATTVKIDKVIVIKQARLLMLMKEGEIFRAYRVALGKKPVGHKQICGDQRTPEGFYMLDSRNPDSRFYKAIHISYPNDNDVTNAQRLGKQPGGNIMIHGLPVHLNHLGPLHRKVDWTDGCIAVTNSEIEEIWQLVPDGTPIEIRP